MITNANLQQIQTPGPSTTGGAPGTYTNTAASARCFIDAPKRSMQSGIAELTKEATAVAYFPKSALGSARFTPRQKLVVALDGSQGTTTYTVVYSTDRQLSGPLSHLEVYLKELA